MKFILLICLMLVGCAQINSTEPTKRLTTGANSLMIEINHEADKKIIEVFYYKPASFNRNSKVLMVIPGAGRNAADYRDSWVASADKYNLLVLTPKYPKNDYDFAAYHLGGVVTDLELVNPKIEKINGRVSKYRMRDEDIKFSFSANPSLAIFNDFDAIFSQIKKSERLHQKNYDLFGHSAGGQILHRYAIFNSSSLANHIVCANSGFYTLPNLQKRFPFGLTGTSIQPYQFESIFATNLIVMVGENDNQTETRGTMLHTPIADSQGLGRLERGKHFYENSQLAAKAAQVPFNWKLVTVKGVGHDYKKMGVAAAQFLYSADELHLTR